MTLSTRAFAFALSITAACSGSNQDAVDGAPDAPVITIEGWAAAPDLGTVEVVPNRDSAIVRVPEVAGAADYRVIVVESGVTVGSATDGSEEVRGAAMFCAGRAQHGAPASQTGNPVLRAIEVTGLGAHVQLAVEALDRECPFTGVLGAAHAEIGTSNDVHGMGAPAKYAVVTEAEVRARYGSLIVNGHGPAGPLGSATSAPVIGDPAAPALPRVLARSFVEVTPTGTSDSPMPFWEDFAAPDPFVAVGTYPQRDSSPGMHWQNARWNLYAMGVDTALYGGAGTPTSQAFASRGELRLNVDDWAQDIFGVVQLVPREPVHLSTTTYLHVTFETSMAPTNRRYNWIDLCGAPTAGGTFDAAGHVRGRLSMTPFFYQTDGLSPYTEGWNCLQIFPFEGGYYALGGRKPETSVRVIINRATPGDPNNRDNAVNIGPPAYGADPSCAWCGFYGVLDELQRTAPRVRFDLYVKRDRVILLADHHQLLCADFPHLPLTMAEGALGLGGILYHSSAEHTELFRDDWLKDGQRYYLSNTPWIDSRGWDNIGFEEGVAAPPGFAASSCWVSEKT